MAIRTSNQITFTEQKKIIELKEWYLATPLYDGVTRETEGWTTTTQAVNSENRYLWNYEEVIYSIGEPDISDPILIGVYSIGTDGKGITHIENYYGVTQESDFPEELPDNFWNDNFTTIEKLSSTNKYLWSYEEVFYTDGSSEVSDPMIVGVYGDSGEDAITFQIYSPDGFEFKDNIEESEKLNSIELKLAAFKGSNPLTGATYTWAYWDSSLNDGEGGYENIEGYINTTDTLFTVKKDDSYAFANLKCTMIYDGKSYDDYVTLTEKIDVYTANIKFFNNSNVFEQGEEYLVGYVELYKNNKLEESIETEEYYIGSFSVDNETGVINTDYLIDVNEGLTDNILTYFIDVDNNEIILGQYVESQWILVDIQTRYIYKNNINLDSTSNIFVVSKKNINKSQNVNVSVYSSYIDIIGEDGNINTSIDLNSLVSITNAVVTDLNDVIISSETPEGIYDGQMWLDTTDGILKIYTNGQWVNTAKQNNGQNTYTKYPSFYQKGDIWIVSKEDETGDFVEGSIWIAKQDSDETGFNAEHWSDAVPEITALQSNVNYYFDFNKQTGLKIGHNNDRFYVNIKSTRMSFCENTDVVTSGNDEEEIIDPHEVVYIGNRSATIRNLVVEESANFNCQASINNQVNIVNTYSSKNTSPGFSWQVEPDGGFSLVKMEVE